MHDTCPKCGSSLKCLGGESAHPDNWYCIQEQRCGWKAWDPVESEVIRLGTKSTRIKALEARVKELEKRIEWAIRVKASGMIGFTTSMLLGKWEYLDHNLGSYTLREYVEAVEQEDKEYEEKAAKKKNRESRKG